MPSTQNMLEPADWLNSCAAALPQFTCSSVAWSEVQCSCKLFWRVWGDSAMCDLFLSKPCDVPIEPSSIRAVCKVLPATFAALSISCVSEIGRKLNRNVGTRLTGTGRKAVCLSRGDSTCHCGDGWLWLYQHTDQAKLAQREIINLLKM